MSQVENKNFGLLIAYLIPGFVTLMGLSPYSQTVQSWLGTTPAQAPSVGGFLFATIASVAAGLTASTIRWLLLDHVHALTGLRPPELDFSKLQANIDAFQMSVEYHYRYYQFYGNTLIASFVLLAGHWTGLPVRRRWVGVLVCVTLGALFFVASRDALRKYYARLTVFHSEATLIRS